MIDRRTIVLATTLLGLAHVATAKPAEVTAGVLNVRAGPSRGHKVVGQLTQGKRVKVVASRKSWREIAYRGQTAWVHGDYLAAVSATPPAKTTPTLPSAWDEEPPARDMRRVYFRGVRVNKRTIELIRRAERIMRKLGHPGFRFVITQGSYSNSVAASAGTHSGGGALDLRTRGHSTRTVNHMIRALRRAGFAAWSRGRGYDSFTPHIHAIAIGDPDLSFGARSQVRSYALGRNGLRSQALDPDRKLGRHAPLWAYRALGWKRPKKKKKPAAKKRPAAEPAVAPPPTPPAPRRVGMSGLIPN